MRILLHTINHAPELTGIGKVNGELVAWLAARGHAVRVVTAPPYYPEWRVHQGYSGSRYQCEMRDGARIIRCPLWVPAHPGGAKRLIHLASFALASLPVLLRQCFWRPQVVMVIEPALFCAPGALLAARLSGATAWLHVQDFEVDAAFELGLLKSALIRRMVTAMETWLMRRFDVVSSISGAMVARLGGKGVAEANTCFLPNWVDVDFICPMTRPSPYRAELGIAEGRLVALYSGNMGKKQGIDLVIDAARALAADSTVPLQFVLCGRGVEYDQLKQQAADLPNILWLPLQPYERLNELLNLADIHLLPQKATAADLVMPSKLPSMLASGRAVIATAEPDTEVARVMADCGEVVTPGSVEDFVMALRRLAADAAARAGYGEQGRRRAVEMFSREQILSRLLEQLEAMRC
jgi:colanic acid biosynthesis glycosyl transferase WcaI